MKMILENEGENGKVKKNGEETHFWRIMHIYAYVGLLISVYLLTYVYWL